MAKKISTIDLFAGCGGLTEGFESTGYYDTIACVEWDEAPCDNLRNRMLKKWNHPDAKDIVMRFDIQRTNELISGWDDIKYGVSPGLDYYVNRSGGGIDLIIGGPPCQSYSIAGRIRDKDGMKNDYRNYLFESYLKIVEHYKPKAFVFENVPGMLSARPGNGTKLVSQMIQEGFSKSGYALLKDLKRAVVDFTEYGVPQNRRRVIILGLNKEVYGDNADALLEKFYSVILPSFKTLNRKTVWDAISDLDPLYPLDKATKGRSHSMPKESKIKNHTPCYSNSRDMEVFRVLAQDIESGKNEYISTDSLKNLYTEVTGKTSNVYKYHVIRWDEPSNTIPAHLNKDGLRHIHPDSKQSRTITVREAARLQTFPDDYEFISGMSLNYKMIGNAVPPLMAQKIALSIYNLLFKEE